MVADTLHENDINPAAARIQRLHNFCAVFEKVTVDVLRLDLIHPVVSGNKYFKLYYPLKNALSAGKKGIITYGGPYSNHLVATAFSCYKNGLKSIGMVRGEEPKIYSPTLKDAQSYGMELRFVAREFYRDLPAESPLEWEIVNEGGCSEAGVRGAGKIAALFDSNLYTHVICSVGTGTTMAGLMQHLPPTVRVIGIPALKITAADNELTTFVMQQGQHSNSKLILDYHFGGYAKKNTQLIEFMNELYGRFKLPTDFVYTAKMFYAVNDLISKQYFGEKASLLVIHSGGLQGNRSLSAGSLKF